MSGGDIAGLIAAGVFAVLVAIAAVPLLKLGKVFDEARRAIHDVGDGAAPLLTELTSTVSQANRQLTKVDGVTTDIADVSSNVSSLAALFTATLGSPLVKVAAFSYGVRQAMRTRTRKH